MAIERDSPKNSLHSLASVVDLCFFECMHFDVAAYNITEVISEG
jgi:hypothetical protein